MILFEKQEKKLIKMIGQKIHKWEELSLSLTVNQTEAN